MDNENWEYKITVRPFDFIPPLILLAVFGGGCLWLYLSHNSAFIVSLPLAAIALFFNLATVYSALFVKLFVGRAGFYHQTRPGNGKYYTYAEVQRAWQSMGSNGRGQFTYITADGKIVRFAIANNDSDAIDCLLRRINGGNGKIKDDEDEAVTEAENEKWDYIIDGKAGGVLGMTITAVPMAFFVLLAIDQFQPSPNKLLILAFMATASALMLFSSLVKIAVRYFCFKICIGKKGFYFQSNPFDGKYYEYTKIRSYNEQTQLHKGVSRQYFCFTPKGGETKRVPLGLADNLCRHELTVLKKRIRKALREENNDF